MNENQEKVGLSVKKVNQQIIYFAGWLLIIFSVAYWTSNLSLDSPTLVNRLRLNSQWLLPAHLILTSIGLILIATSGYSEQIGKMLSLRFYKHIIVFHERKITNLSLQKPEASQDPSLSIFNLIKIFTIVILALLTVDIIFSFMSKVILVPCIDIILFIIILPFCLIWINLKKLCLSDFETLKQGKFKDYYCSNATGAIKVYDNQIAYVKTSDDSYKLLSVGDTEIVSGTSCRIFDQSFFHIKKDALRLHSDLKSDGSEMTISVEISPVLRNFPKLINKHSYEFNSFFISDNLDHQLYSMIPHELIIKANSAKNINLEKLHELILDSGKSVSEINNLTSSLFNKEIYTETSTQIRLELIKHFNKSLGSEDAFNITVELDDKLDRAAFSKEVNRKVEEYFKNEERRKIEEKVRKDKFNEEVKIKAMDLTAKIIEKTGLDQQNQTIIIGNTTDILSDTMSISKPAQLGLNSSTLESHAKELIEAHDYILAHQEQSNESKLQYLQGKNFFKEYPKIKPTDVYNKIIEMDRNRREEKMQEALRELINSNKLLNG